MTINEKKEIVFSLIEKYGWSVENFETFTKEVKGNDWKVRVIKRNHNGGFQTFKRKLKFDEKGFYVFLDTWKAYLKIEFVGKSIVDFIIDYYECK